ncbi:MAG: addiction module protein [Planctomycetia bacterium]|nr:addiction module protein [Planctomycetia bacterium]
MSDLSQLTQQALSLPFIDRVRLAQDLWASVQPAEDETSNEVAEAVKEAERRDAEFESGVEKGVPHDEAMRALRKSIECD